MMDESQTITSYIDYEAKIFQLNGQRKYGGPPENWVGDPPPKGTEIFIGSLPREFKENSFVPLFAKVGKIYCTRLMMDFSGRNRGFAYIQYSKKEEAKKAIQELHGYEIKPGIKLHVTKSVDNCRLFVGHVPKTLNKEQIENVLNANFDNIKQVFIYYNANDKSLNRGFCFVEFEDHRAACLARRKFFTTGCLFEWPEVILDWAVPEEDVDEEVMNSVTVMYMRNLMLKTSEATIREVVLKYVKPCEIYRIRKVQDYAFVHFSNRAAASNAIQHIDGSFIDGAEISATWAKPAYALEKPNTAGCKTSRKPNNNRIDKERNNDVFNNSLNYTKFDQESTGKIHCSTPIQSAGRIVNFSNSSSPITYGSVSGPPCTIVQNKNANIVRYDSRNDRNVQNIIKGFFSTFPPAEALQKLYHYYDWGDVNYNIWTVSNAGNTCYIATINIHHGPSRATATMHNMLCTTPLLSREEAKDAAARAFVSNYLWKHVNTNVQ